MHTVRAILVVGCALVAVETLAGCAWTGGSLAGLLLLVLLASVAACGGQVTESAEDAAAGDGSGGEGAGAAGGGGFGAGAAGAGGSAVGGAGTGGGGGSPVEACGEAVCPAHMVCGAKGSEPWCLPDADEDGHSDLDDDCPYAADPDQADADGDGVGDRCDVCDGPNDTAPGGVDACTDADGDGIPGVSVWPGASDDNCPYLAGADQTDTDFDGVGDACDLCPTSYNPLSPCGDPCLDSDGDSVADPSACGGAIDGCAFTPSEPSDDADGDAVGDVCDPDGVPPESSAAADAVRHRNRRRELLRELFAAGVLDEQTVRLARRVGRGHDDAAA